jgi:hypothetical protein
MTIFFHQTSVIGSKETGMGTQLVKLIRDCKCLCPSRRKQQRVIHLEIVFRIIRHPRAIKRRWKEQEFLPQASFPYRKQKQPSREAIQPGDLR